MPEPLPDVVATRRYALHAADGSPAEAELRIHRPEPLDAPPGDHRCRVELVGPTRTVSQYAYGVDAVQALVLGLALARLYVTTPALIGAERLTWLDADDPGIPPQLSARPEAPPAG